LNKVITSFIALQFYVFESCKKNSNYRKMREIT